MGVGRRARRRPRGSLPGRRRRRLPPGRDGGAGARLRRHRRLRVPQRRRHRRAAGGAGAPALHRPPGVGRLDGGLRRGALRLRAARRRAGRAALARGAGGGSLRATLPALRAPSGAAQRARGHAARPAQRVRRHQAAPGAPVRGVRPRVRGGPDRAALPQRLRTADAPRHPLRRRGQHLPQRSGGRRAGAGVRGRRPAARLRARARRGPRGGAGAEPPGRGRGHLQRGQRDTAQRGRDGGSTDARVRRRGPRLSGHRRVPAG